MLKLSTTCQFNRQNRPRWRWPRHLSRQCQSGRQKTAKEVIQALKAESPAIYTREYQANNGIIEFDIRSVNQEEMNKIVQRLQEIMDTKEK